MTVASPEHLDEILIVLRPRLSRSGVERYDANVYAAPNVNVPLTTSRDGPPVADLPLRGVEHVKVQWSAYREFLEMFHDGEKAAHHMRARLSEAVSPGLHALLEASTWSARRTRIWWSCESPEIEELPWELLLRPQDSHVSFVRGMPASPRALVPRRGTELRLAVISKDISDAGLLGLIGSFPGVSVAFVSGQQPVREALTGATREGMELIHIIADGWTLASWDAMLEFEGDDALSPSELCTRLRGSRVVALGLSPVSRLSGDRHGPHAFRAFSHIPGAIDTTNVVAQLGPWNPAMPQLFRTVYAELARSGSVESAVSSARSAGRHVAPLALFLRQRLGRELATSASKRSTPKQEPQQVQTHIDAARQLMDQLKAVESRYAGLASPLSGSEAFRKQEQGVRALDADLAPWTTLEDDER